jgi:hypothetical protein
VLGRRIGNDFISALNVDILTDAPIKHLNMRDANRVLAERGDFAHYTEPESSGQSISGLLGGERVPIPSHRRPW